MFTETHLSPPKTNLHMNFKGIVSLDNLGELEADVGLVS